MQLVAGHGGGARVLAYWLLFGLIAFGAMFERVDTNTPRRLEIPLFFGAVAIAIFIGIRFEVGGDYGAYQGMLERASRFTFWRTLEYGDPAYEALNWLTAEFGLGLWVVNSVCAAIFMWGLVRLAQNQPVPWLAILVAVPYLIVVVAMGYTRQAVAIGFIMAGMASLGRGKSVLIFAIYVAAAALFHRTAVLVLPLAIFAGQRNNVLNAIAIIAIAIGLYDMLLADSVDLLVENYLDQRYASQGALIRVMMNLIPALIVLSYGSRLGFTSYELRLWRMMAFVALALVPALFLLPSSTAVDRMALYVLPIQVVVLSRSLFLFRQLTIGRLAIVGYSFAVLFVWLNFAVHARYWVPYQVYPFGERVTQQGTRR